MYNHLKLTNVQENKLMSTTELFWEKYLQHTTFTRSVPLRHSKIIYAPLINKLCILYELKLFCLIDFYIEISKH